MDNTCAICGTALERVYYLYADYCAVYADTLHLFSADNRDVEIDFRRCPQCGLLYAKDRLSLSVRPDKQ